MGISADQFEDIRAQVAEVAVLLRRLATRIEGVASKLDEALSSSAEDGEER